MRRELKYGVAFTLFAFLFAFYAFQKEGFFYLILWPAMSFGLVAAAYFGVGVKVFGKMPCGRLPIVRCVLLFPFLGYMSFVWHAMRFVSSEPAFNQLTESVFIGRRLLSSERAAHFDHVVDLTCEFREPFAMRSKGYIACPVLDGHFRDPDVVMRWVADVALLDGNVYIHCAQGHGRTASFAVAYLLFTGQASTVDEAAEQVLRCRPGAHMNRSQRAIQEKMVFSEIDDNEPPST